jgi:ABC-type branched-subunit amino acid transport system ATPase component/ABC-type branched-subunit amino acid transport system permease subunit
VSLALPIEFSSSAAVLGIITGLGYGLLATGLVLVYRTNRIINFAHGEMGALGAAFFLLLARKAKLPYYVSLPLALAIGAGIAAIAEVVVIRRLRAAPRLMSLVATLGLGQLLFVLTLAAGSAAGAAAFFPAPPGLPQFAVGAGLLVRPAASGLLFFSPILVVALAVFLRRSRFGLALRSASANPEAARMAGVFASRMSTLAWAIGGALSTFTAILIAPELPGGLFTAASFGPSLLMRGLAGAIIARMSNLPVALASGIGIGLVEGIILQNTRSGALMDMALFVIILVALLFQSREGTREEEKGSVWASVQPWRPLSEQVAKLWAVRNLGWILAAVILVPLAVWPLWLSDVTAIALTGLLCLVMVALSVGVVTGLSGQLTLGQFALAAVGAGVSAVFASRTGGNPLSFLLGGLAAAVMAIVIGLPALRIKGLFLAVTTLAFAVAMGSWVLIQPWALGPGISSGTPNIAGRSLEPGRTYYYFALLIFLILFLLSRNIRKTGFGRLLRAVRDNEDAARAFALPARRIKIQGFLLGGFIAGFAGAAYGHSFSSIAASQFPASYSVDVVVMTVAGGIGILPGPLLGVTFVKGIPTFFSLRTLAIFTQRLGLLLLIMYFPGGLVQLIGPVRDRIVRWLGRRSGVTVDEDEAPASEEAPVFSRVQLAGGPATDGVHASPREDVLEALEVTKRYGGLTAVDAVTLIVGKGETLGLIGPNGAGKTTLFEALAGFVKPESGRVRFENQDITKWSPEKRAEVGLIRSFQDVQLFPTMSVLETVQLALERRLRTSFFESLVGMSARDRAKEKLARDIVGSMGLWSFRNKQIQELSTGTRRITELACMVSLQPKVLLLDEPSSGIAQRETEALGALLNDLKARHDMTLVVIEHDIPLIMNLADRIVAMDAGHVIAEGPPQIVRDNPAVVEAYLGGRLEAIERSGTLARNSRGNLENVPGLGSAKRAALLETFGSIEAIRDATVAELTTVSGVGPNLALKILERLRDEKEPSASS